MGYNVGRLFPEDGLWPGILRVGGAFLEDGLGSSEDRLWAGVLEGVLRE